MSHQYLTPDYLKTINTYKQTILNRLSYNNIFEGRTNLNKFTQEINV